MVVLWSISRAAVWVRKQRCVNALVGAQPLSQPRIVPTPVHPPPPSQWRCSARRKTASVLNAPFAWVDRWREGLELPSRSHRGVGRCAITAPIRGCHSVCAPTAVLMSHRWRAQAVVREQREERAPRHTPDAKQTPARQRMPTRQPRPNKKPSGRKTKPQATRAASASCKASRLCRSTKGPRSTVVSWPSRTTTRPLTTV